MNKCGVDVSERLSVKDSKRRNVFKTLRRLEDLEGIRDIWSELQSTMSADIDFFKTIMESQNAAVRPHVMLLMSGDMPRAIMVGKLENTRIKFRLGYKAIFEPKTRVLRIVAGGFMGDVSRNTSMDFVLEIIHCLKRGEADLAIFENVKLDSALYIAIRTIPSFFFRDHFIEYIKHWVMRLPSNIDGLYARMNSKHRRWIRRLPRVLERDYPGQIEFRTIETPDEVEMLCKDAEYIAKKTYQRALGVGFIDSEINRRRFNLEAEKGWLHAEMLYIAEHPSAFWIGSRYGNTVFLAYTGYDPKFRKYELGTILFFKMVQNLINMNVDTMDFGSGDAFYKERFGDEYWEDATLNILAPNFRGFRIGLMRDSVLLCRSLAMKALSRTDFTQKVKTWWRKRSISKGQAV